MNQREPKTETLSVSDVKRRFDGLVDAVFRKQTRVLVERNGVPVAALVSTDDLERLAAQDRERERRRELLTRLRAPFRHIPAEQIEQDVARVIAEVRAEVDAEQNLAASER